MAVNHINSRSFNEDDSEKVDRMSVSDSLFVRYVNKQVNDTLLFTRQEKCTRFVGTAMVEAKFQLLARQRKEAFMEHFLKIGGKGRINVSPGVNIIPYNGFSFYSIDYNGELPKKLLSAYRQMNELNKESPRKKFRKERRQNRSVIDK